MKGIAKTAVTLGLAGFAAMSSPFVAAADSGWYGGLGIGQSSAKIDDARITSELLGSGLATTSVTDDNRDIGYKIFGGLKISKNFALEAGYFNLGKFGFTAMTSPAGTLTGKLKLQGLNVDAVGILPITEKFSAFGRIGVQYAQVKDSFAGTGNVAVTNPTPSKSAANYKAGFGIQYDFTESVGLRGEYERYRINDAVGNRGDVDMLSVGLVFLFGGDKSASPRAATPPPRAIEAVPVLVVVPIPPERTQQYCSILDLQFEIDQNAIQRESEEKIDKVAAFMQKYPDTTVLIQGHSDEVGTLADNMRLSERRAESVVNYLVRRGIARYRMMAAGYGDTRPVANNRTEVGRRLNRRINAIIACATDIEGLTPIPARVTMAMEMEFDTNQADVRPQYRDELRKVANFMKANPGVNATVEGHTSNQLVDREQAMQLSQRRAHSVVDYLVYNFGIARSRLSAEGFGATRRFAYNTSAEGQRENRRVNIIFDFPK
jgi:OmpA-OmpF porin, OOP family